MLQTVGEVVRTERRVYYQDLIIFNFNIIGRRSGFLGFKLYKSTSFESEEKFDIVLGFGICL